MTDSLEWLTLAEAIDETAAEPRPAAPPPPADTPTPEPTRPLPPPLPPQVTVVPPPERWLAAEVVFAPPKLFSLRLQAERLNAGSGFETLIALDDVAIDHLQHQIDAARRVLRELRGRALLADEVGLGKTIEAGLVMKELLERRLIESILIITPASLTGQWQEEMAAKFFEDFTILTDLEQLVDARPGRWLISLTRAARPDWSRRLLQHNYDLLIVDEAHKLKNHRTRAYRFVNQIQKRYVLLLTATPVQNNLLELYNLITILRPGHLSTRSDFRNRFIEAGQNRRRANRRSIYSSDAVPDYLKMSRNRRDDYLQANPAYFSEIRAESTRDFLVFRNEYLSRLPPNDLHHTTVEEIYQLQAQGYEIVDFEALRVRRWNRTYLHFVCRLRLLPRDEEESRPTGRQLNARNPAQLRSILREVMIRNRRSSVGMRLPPREAAIYHLNLTPPERRLYDLVSGYIREQLRRLENEEGPKRRRGTLKLRLLSLQRQLTSSPQAVARSLRRFSETEAAQHGRVDPRLQDALHLAESIPQGRKVAATQIILEQYPGKCLIFTDYRPTLEALAEALRAAGEDVVVFHGGLDAQERQEAVRAFRGPARVMISSRSGGEGHNLQFCHQLINYDIPWNPMRLEQRIGRLHRLGQTETVRIFNLSATRTIEAQILDLLGRKIRMFELVIGELDLILGHLDEQAGFEDLLAEAWAESYDDATLAAKIAALETMIDRAHTSYQTIRRVSDELADLLDTER